MAAATAANARASARPASACRWTRTWIRSASRCVCPSGWALALILNHRTSARCGVQAAASRLLRHATAPHLRRPSALQRAHVRLPARRRPLCSSQAAARRTAGSQPPLIGVDAAWSHHVSQAAQLAATAALRRAAAARRVSSSRAASRAQAAAGHAAALALGTIAFSTSPPLTPPLLSRGPSRPLRQDRCRRSGLQTSPRLSRA